MTRVALTYHGAACKTCGGTKRYAANRLCVLCASRGVKARRLGMVAERPGASPRPDWSEHRLGLRAQEALRRKEEEYAAAAARRVRWVFDLAGVSHDNVTGD